MSTGNCVVPMIPKTGMLPRAKGSQVHLRICQETLIEGVDSQVSMASVSGICKKNQLSFRHETSLGIEEM